MSAIGIDVSQNRNGLVEIKSGLRTSLRVHMTLGGAFCVAGALGPAIGEMRPALIGVVGWVFGIFIACVLLAILFARQDASAECAFRGKGGTRIGAWLATRRWLSEILQKNFNPASRPRLGT